MWKFKSTDYIFSDFFWGELWSFCLHSFFSPWFLIDLSPSVEQTFLSPLSIFAPLTKAVDSIYLGLLGSVFYSVYLFVRSFTNITLFITLAFVVKLTVMSVLLPNKEYLHLFIYFLFFPTMIQGFLNAYLDCIWIGMYFVKSILKKFNFEGAIVSGIFFF